MADVSQSVRGSHVRTAQREHGNARHWGSTKKKSVGKKAKDGGRMRITASIPSLQ
jgi:hypothetical protein